MYTVEDNKNDVYEEEYYEGSFWDNNKSLIIKLIIIVLCVIVLIWLFKALNAKRNASDDSVHVANVEKVRLAAEDYFFIKNNKNDNGSKTVNLLTLKNEGLIDNIIDANNKTCSENDSDVSLVHEKDAYTMTVKLSCSTNDKKEKFYYHNNTLACLNCNGKTKTANIKNNTEKEIKGEEIKNDDYIIPVNNDESSKYSCVNWSDWTKDRDNNKYLSERSKTLVQGVKYGGTTETVYSEWSDYSTTPIVASDGLEVETKVVSEEVWSDIKVAQNINSNNAIKIVNIETVNDISNVCVDGFMVNDTCYSNKLKVGNLTFSEYNSGKYNIQNRFCEGIKTLKNKEGKYALTYVGCRYNEAIDMQVVNNSYNVYRYKQLETKDVTYYRFRVVTTTETKTDPVYTKDKYEEKYLPEGYVKVDGTEETYYSYKYATCEK